MRRICLSAAGLALAGGLAGCGGTAQLGPATPAKYRPVPPVRGADVWHEAKKLVRYQENVAASDATRSKAIETQKNAAPHGIGEGREGATSPPTLEGAADNLLEALTLARDAVGVHFDQEEAKARELIAKSKGTLYSLPDDMDAFLEGLGGFEERKRGRRELTRHAYRIRLHAHEIMSVLEGRERQRRLARDLPALREFLGDAALAEPVGPAADEEDIRPPSRLIDRARLVEANAVRFWRAAAGHSPSRVREWWGPLLASCRGIPRIASEIDAIEAGTRSTKGKKGRGKAGEKAGGKTAGKVARDDAGKDAKKDAKADAKAGDRAK